MDKQADLILCLVELLRRLDAAGERGGVGGVGRGDGRNESSNEEEGSEDRAVNKSSRGKERGDFQDGGNEGQKGSNPANSPDGFHSPAEAPTGAEELPDEELLERGASLSTSGPKIDVLIRRMEKLERNQEACSSSLKRIEATQEKILRLLGSMQGQRGIPPALETLGQNINQACSASAMQETEAQLKSMDERRTFVHARSQTGAPANSVASPSGPTHGSTKNSSAAPVASSSSSCGDIIFD
ncbi:uncharacterized protein LOC129328752 [Eublepharis macularius]|uniref:Uncharacterized protein LOC129328752 n=1 Tax=Eublepharis macularius TaxID=481883 RepID=A0AA97JAQ1_EUBMA|nr:uncharacterized protein LOC129328752 [Eublepharis macularius]XP_054834006.1 uncharacterized protein LOC129328752 [Eublepharis macularius]